MPEEALNFGPEGKPGESPEYGPEFLPRLVESRIMHLAVTEPVPARLGHMRRDLVGSFEADRLGSGFTHVTPNSNFILWVQSRFIWEAFGLATWLVT